MSSKMSRCEKSITPVNCPKTDSLGQTLRVARLSYCALDGVIANARLALMASLKVGKMSGASDVGFDWRG